MSMIVCCGGNLVIDDCFKRYCQNMMDLFSYKENALKNLLAQEAAIGAESLGRITLRILQ